jgi:hypothetical protein
MRHVDTILSLAGANTSAFFPRRKSATTILKLHLSNKAIQILSGNISFFHISIFHHFLTPINIALVLKTRLLVGAILPSNP